MLGDAALTGIGGISDGYQCGGTVSSSSKVGGTKQHTGTVISAKDELVCACAPLDARWPPAVLFVDAAPCPPAYKYSINGGKRAEEQATRDLHNGTLVISGRALELAMGSQEANRNGIGSSEATNNRRANVR